MAINAEIFLRALDELEATKGISKELILQTLKEVLEKGLRRQIGFDEARVECVIDSENGTIALYQVLTVVDNVEEEGLDEALEISLEDARKINPDVKVGDEIHIDSDPKELAKSTAMAIKSMLKQRFAEAEKANLYEAFKDKIGTMVQGVVDKADDRGLTISIGKASVFLPKTAMIGDEKFLVGEQIKLFVTDVASGTKGAHILVSRANEGFLKALFFEELPDIYDGTIIIKAIARRAGERSKVAVYSNDPNVDPAGACIGQNGTKIQKIVGQLGNGSAKEKIDIIAWSENKALFVMEALKPAEVLGINLSEDGKNATVIVSNDSFSLAIGRRGVNVNLAVKLTSCHIDIKTEDDAKEEGVVYTTFDEIQALEVAEKARRIRELQAASLVYADANTSLPGLPDDYVAPQDRKYEEEEDEDINEALLEASENEDIETPTVTTEEVVETPVEEVIETPVEEVEETVEEEVIETPVEVKTTTTLDDLEKSLEQDKNKSKSKGYSKRKKNTKKEEEEEASTITPTVDPSTYMSIYTDEELAEMDEEEEYDDYDDEDIDYDEYDSYYDDDNN